MPELKIVSNATCTFCGCVCDDMELTVEGDHITKAKNACVLGKAWFLNHHVEERPVATIAGQPASLEDAVERAAQVLANARYPIVYGLSDTTCEAQRVAVAIADRIGGCVDTTTSVCHGPSGMAFQGVGEVTCSLGEVKNRADLVIFWGSNPAESHPRHWGRYSTMPKGLFRPDGQLLATGAREPGPHPVRRPGPQGDADGARGGGRLHDGHLRHQHGGDGLPHGRRADPAAAGVCVAVPER